MWKGVEPKSVGHAGLEHLLEDDSCGFEKFLKNETPVVDNGPCCQKMLLLFEENVCSGAVVRWRASPVAFMQPRLAGQLLKKLVACVGERLSLVYTVVSPNVFRRTVQ